LERLQVLNKKQQELAESQRLFAAQRKALDGAKQAAIQLLEI
jgi:hypothetical protein